MSKLTDMLNKYRNTKIAAVRVGIMDQATYPDGTGVAQVGYVNEYGTDVIPTRPFFRSAIANNRKILPEMMAGLMKKHDVETALKLVGEHMVGELTHSVMTWQDPPNAQSTILNKGYNAPLRANDKLLRKSFTVELESDD